MRYFHGVLIHDPEVCTGYCPFDNPSNHKMKTWRKKLRLGPSAPGLIERACEHDFAHPDPDSVVYMNKLYKHKDFGVHGCDGCCG